MSGNDERVNTWAKAAYEIQTAGAILKTCSECGEPTMKVPNKILCSATGELIKGVVKK